MDEMVNRVAERTGISADTVRTVLASAAEYIKERVPPPMADQIDMLVKGAGGAGGPGSNPNPLGAIAGTYGNL